MIGMVGLEVKASECVSRREEAVCVYDWFAWSLRVHVTCVWPRRWAEGRGRERPRPVVQTRQPQKAATTRPRKANKQGAYKPYKYAKVSCLFARLLGGVA